MQFALTHRSAGRFLGCLFSIYFGGAPHRSTLSECFLATVFRTISMNSNSLKCSCIGGRVALKIDYHEWAEVGGVCMCAWEADARGRVAARTAHAPIVHPMKSVKNIRLPIITGWNMAIFSVLHPVSSLPPFCGWINWSNFGKWSEKKKKDCQILQSFSFIFIQQVDEVLPEDWIYRSAVEGPYGARRWDRGVLVGNKIGWQILKQQRFTTWVWSTKISQT